VVKRVTIKDIAEQAGVSLGTVHCALAGKMGVSEATRQRVLAIAKKNHYRPNAMAASLKRKALTIAAAFPEASGENRYYFTPVWQGVRDYLNSVGDYKIDYIEIPYSKSLDNQEDRISRLYNQGRLDGLLTVGFMDDFGQASLANFGRQNIPVVLVGDDIPHSSRLRCIQPNYSVIGQMMADLVTRMIPENGSILLCAGNIAMPSHYLIVLGFDTYLSEKGLENPVYKIHTESLGHDGHLRIARELERHPDITCCLSVNARCSVMLGRALIESGRAGVIPAIGSDIFPENAELLESNVFTHLVHKNQYQQSYLAAECLTDYLLRDTLRGNDVIFVSSEIVFQSTLSMYQQNGRYKAKPAMAF